MISEKNCISQFSHIHSLTQLFLLKELSQKGLKDFVSSHGNILYQLSICDRLTMSELAEKINRDKSTTTVLVRKLVDEGLIAFCENSNDRRSKFLFLTDVGKKYNQKITEISASLNKTFFENISENEKISLFKILQKICDNFEN